MNSLGEQMSKQGTRPLSESSLLELCGAGTKQTREELSTKEGICSEDREAVSPKKMKVV